jgi:inner membrane transporter RhtA
VTVAWARPAARVPAPALFAVSGVFHYLGPALAVLLFARVEVLGVAWLRIASAAVVFAAWRRPWRQFRRLGWRQRRLVLYLGVVLALMNTSFYLAVARLPLATVGAIEFLGVVALAAFGARNRRNLLALALATGGVAVLTDVRVAGEPLGFAFAAANLVLFVGYVVLGHRIANDGAGIDQLAAAMVVATIVATPIGVVPAAAALPHPAWLLAGVAVGICSSVIPYVIDQVVMARLRRASFALMLSILPASAAVIGAIVLSQLPTTQDLTGIAMVAIAVAIHQGPTQDKGDRCGTNG